MGLRRMVAVVHVGAGVVGAVIQSVLLGCCCCQNRQSRERLVAVEQAVGNGQHELELGLGRG